MLSTALVLIDRRKRRPKGDWKTLSCLGILWRASNFEGDYCIEFVLYWWDCNAFIMKWTETRQLFLALHISWGAAETFTSSREEYLRLKEPVVRKNYLVVLRVPLRAHEEKWVAQLECRSCYRPGVAQDDVPLQWDAPQDCGGLEPKLDGLLLQHNTMNIFCRSCLRLYTLVWAYEILFLKSFSEKYLVSLCEIGNAWHVRSI